MKKLLIFTRYILIAFLLSNVSSCKDDDEVLTGNSGATKTAMDYINENSDLSSLKAAIERAGLTEVLQDPKGRYTLLAPTNESFTDFLSANGFANLDAVPIDVLKLLLASHLIEGLQSDDKLDASKATYFNTAGIVDSGARSYAISMYFNNDKETTPADSYFINGNEVKTLSVNAPTRNAIIHKINSVIGVPSFEDVLNFDKDFSSLKAAIAATGLTAAVNATNDVTLLSPENKAFEKFLPEAGFAGGLVDVDTAEEIEVVKEILLNHLVTQALTSKLEKEQATGYVPNSSTASVDGSNLVTFYQADGEFIANGKATALVKDIGTSNGVMQKLDAVVGLPTLTTFIVADPNFGSLLGVLLGDGQPDFVTTLSGSAAPAPFTVFAPGEDGFKALNNKLTPEKDKDEKDVPKPFIDQVNGNELSVGLITATLNQHVIQSENLLKASLINGDLQSLGGPVTVNLDSDPTLTNESGIKANIKTTDIIATNGVIHAIDQVLLPVFETKLATSTTITGLKAKVVFIKNDDNTGTVEVIVDGVPDSFTGNLETALVNNTGTTAVTLDPIVLEKGYSITGVSQLDNGTPINYDALKNFDGKIQIKLNGGVILDGDL